MKERARSIPSDAQIVCRIAAAHTRRSVATRVECQSDVEAGVVFQMALNGAGAAALTASSTAALAAKPG